MFKFLSKGSSGQFSWESSSRGWTWHGWLDTPSTRKWSVHTVGKTCLQFAACHDCKLYTTLCISGYRCMITASSQSTCTPCSAELTLQIFVSLFSLLLELTVSLTDGWQALGCQTGLDGEGICGYQHGQYQLLTVLVLFVNTQIHDNIVQTVDEIRWGSCS